MIDFRTRRCRAIYEHWLRLPRPPGSQVPAKASLDPAAIPALRDAEQVMRRIVRAPGVVYTALVPNVRGGERAIDGRVDEFNLVMSASATHNLANLRMLGIAGADISDAALEGLVDTRCGSLTVVDVCGCRGLSRSVRQAAHGGKPLRIRAAIRKERGDAGSEDDVDEDGEEYNLIPRRRAAAKAVGIFEEILDSDDDANENWKDDGEEEEEEEDDDDDEEEYGGEEEDGDDVSEVPAAPVAPRMGGLKIVMRRK